MCEKYHKLTNALRAARWQAHENNAPRYVAHWADWYGVLDLFELNADTLRPDFYVYPDGDIIRLH